MLDLDLQPHAALPGARPLPRITPTPVSRIHFHVRTEGAFAAARPEEESSPLKQVLLSWLEQH